MDVDYAFGSGSISVGRNGIEIALNYGGICSIMVLSHNSKIDGFLDYFTFKESSY